MKIRQGIKMLLEKKDLIFFVALKIFDLAIAFFINLKIINLLSVEEYGIYNIILSVLGILVTFGFSWTSSSLLYFGTEEKAKYDSLNRTFWARNIILFFSYFILLLFFFIFQKNINQYIGIPVTYFLIFWILVKGISDYLVYYFLAIEKRNTSSLINISARIALLLLLFFKEIDIYKLLFYSIVSDLIPVFFIIRVNKNDFGSFVFDRDIFKRILSFGFWQLFGFAGLYLINFGDNLVIKHYLGTENVGIYNVSYKLFMAISGFSYLLNAYYAPKVVKIIQSCHIEELQQIFYRDRKYIFFLLIFPHLIIILSSSFIIEYIFGVRYSLAAMSTAILTLGSIVRYYTSFNILVYNCFKKYHIMQILNLGQSILNVILDVIFVPRLGITGAAIGTVSSIVLVSIFETIYANTILIKFIGNNTKEGR